MSQCEKCSRDLGPEILSCADLKCGCPYEVHRIPLQKNTSTSQTLIWIGLSIIVLTFVYATPDAETDSFTLLAQIAIACLLGILGLMAFLMGYISLTAEREIVKHRTSGDMWERISSNNREIKARVFNSWKKTLAPENFHKLKLPISQVAFAYYDARYNLGKLLDCKKLTSEDKKKITNAAQQIYSAIIYYCFFTGLWKVNSVRVYTARGESFFNTADEKLYFLRASRDKETEGLAEKSLYWSLLAAGSQFHNPYAISPRDLAYSVFGQSAKAAEFFLKLIYRDMQAENRFSAEQCSEEMNQQIREFNLVLENIDEFRKKHSRLAGDFDHEIDRAFVEGINKSWSRIYTFSGGGLNLKVIRIAIVALALMGFTALQLYFPYRKALTIGNVIERASEGGLEEVGQEYVDEFIARGKKALGIKEQDQDTENKGYEELFASESKISKITALGFLKNAGSLAELERLQERILSMLEDESAEVRQAAADLLGEKLLSPGVAVPKLNRMLSDPNYPNQLSAIRALSKYGSQARIALPDLNRLSGGSDPGLAAEASKAIAAINGNK